MIKLNIKWRDYQIESLNKILESSEGTTHCIKSPRQCGKTTLVEALLLHCSINNRNAVSIFVSPTVRQCKKVFRELRTMIEKLPNCKSCSEATMDINFTNGSQIIFLSAESDIAALQGYTVKNGGILIYDEAAFIKDEVFFALAPTTQVYKSKTILTSTPRWRYGLFYEHFIDGLNKTGHITSHDWGGKTLLTPEKLEFYKRNLPDNLFKNYYLGEFTDFGTGVFGDISTCISNDFVEPYQGSFATKGVDCVFGIDWSTGSGKDETSITVFNSLRQMIYIEHFNNLDETQTIDRIAELIGLFKPTKVQVELNSIGKIFFGLLQKKIKQQNLNTSIKGFNTTNDSKNQLVNKFQVAVQSNDVTILNDEKLLYQMNIFESKPTSTGKVTYAASGNGNDDMVMSTLLAFDALSVGSYNII